MAQINLGTNGKNNSLGEPTLCTLRKHALARHAATASMQAVIERPVFRFLEVQNIKSKNYNADICGS